MSKEAAATNATFVRDVFEYFRYQHTPANSFLWQRWVEVDLFDQGGELQDSSRDVVTRS